MKLFKYINRKLQNGQKETLVFQNSGERMESLHIRYDHAETAPNQKENIKIFYTPKRKRKLRALEIAHNTSFLIYDEWLDIGNQSSIKDCLAAYPNPIINDTAQIGCEFIGDKQ